MRLFDTLTKTKVELPEPPARIGMYTCGPTVYQRIHIGNARPYVISLWLKRWLESRGYDVTLVENITDVNDRIYEAAPNRSAQLAASAAQWYVDDTNGLGLGRPDHEPKATETVAEIVRLIEELISAGYAYEAGGDVYFHVGKFAEYGRLSGQRPDQVEEQEPNPLKHDPRDFSLWKANKEGEDTWWDSPWGRGRPGWHIECSAMAEKFLGPSFEIHLGGLDLVFPHHENERAQSQAAGREFAHIWMHNGLLRLDREKMSKSVGNIASLGDVLERWGKETVLLFFMTGHWSKPIDFSDEVMESAQARVERFREIFRAESQPVGDWEELVAALEDDFNTPEALAVLHGWRDHELLRRALEIFGLGSLAEAVDAPPEVVELAERRRAARAARDFGEADRLRAEIEAAGWEARDVADGFQLVPK
ncbi:MAG TPA: cysteine--tRNA ligase [Gaiellaceae bacterium]|nr:cysteine--tRNA ligase [Gaiellaceae bacterium]